VAKNLASRLAEPFITPRIARADIDASLRQYLLGVYSYMASGLALTGGVAYAVSETGLYALLAHSQLLFCEVALSPLVLVLLLSFRIDSMKLGAARAAFWAYAGLVGLSLSGIFLVYTGASLARTFFIAAATFFAMSLCGYITRIDLARTGSFLLMGLFGIVIAGLVNIFLAASVLQLTISLIGVVVFVGFTACDTQRIKEIFLESDRSVIAGRKAIMGALALYLDFLNLFVLLMQFTGDRRE
jgi:uncharacterized protein